MMIVARLFVVAAIGAAFAVLPAIVHAQELGNPMPGISLEGINPYASPLPTTPLPQITTGAVTLAAQLTDESADIPRGLIWRVFKPEPGKDGKLPLVASSQGGTSTLRLVELAV